MNLTVAQLDKNFFVFNRSQRYCVRQNPPLGPALCQTYPVHIRISWNLLILSCRQWLAIPPEIFPSKYLKLSSPTNQLNLWSTVLQKPKTVAQLVMKFPVIIAFSCSQQSTTGPHPEPDEPTQHLKNLYILRLLTSRLYLQNSMLFEII